MSTVAQSSVGATLVVARLAWHNGFSDAGEHKPRQCTISTGDHKGRPYERVEGRRLVGLGYVR